MIYIVSRLPESSATCSFIIFDRKWPLLEWGKLSSFAPNSARKPDFNTHEIQEKIRKNFPYLLKNHLIWNNSVTFIISEIKFEFGTPASQFWPAECRNFPASGVNLDR